MNEWRLCSIQYKTIRAFYKCMLEKRRGHENFFFLSMYIQKFPVVSFKWLHFYPTVYILNFQHVFVMMMLMRWVLHSAHTLFIILRKTTSTALVQSLQSHYHYKTTSIRTLSDHSTDVFVYKKNKRVTIGNKMEMNKFRWLFFFFCLHICMALNSLSPFLPCHSLFTHTRVYVHNITLLPVSLFYPLSLDMLNWTEWEIRFLTCHSYQVDDGRAPEQHHAKMLERVL